MSTCPRCKHPVQDQDRVSGVEAGDGSETAGLYDCSYCSQWFVLHGDGSTSGAVFE
jgi:hypothetical protein